MPLPLGPLVGFALGVLLALFAPGGSLSEAGPAHPRPRLLVALFASLVFAPVCAYFLAFAGDWSLAYLADSRSVPSALLLILVGVDAASVVFGFSVGRRSLARRSMREVTALIAAPLGAALVLVVLFYGRLRIDGTFHQVRGDFGTQPVAGGPLGYAIVWMLGLVAAGFGLTLRLLRERPRPRISPSDAPPPPKAPLLPRKRALDAPAPFPRRQGAAIPPRR
jgi:hypothetical protein